MVFSPGPSFERDGSHLDLVERHVHVDAETIHTRLAEGLLAELQFEPDFAGSSLHSFESNAFLTRSQMLAKNDENAALERYAKLREGDWRRDFYVKGPFEDWFSEYSQDKERLPFNTDFFIHLEPIGERETRVEVIEYFPRVSAGRSFRFCTRHGGPMFVRDVQAVAPTTRDRRMMLDLVVLVAERETPKLEQPAPE